MDREVVGRRRVERADPSRHPRARVLEARRQPEVGAAVDERGGEIEAVETEIAPARVIGGDRERTGQPVCSRAAQIGVHPRDAFECEARQERAQIGECEPVRAQQDSRLGQRVAPADAEHRAAVDRARIGSQMEPAHLETPLTDRGRERQIDSPRPADRTALRDQRIDLEREAASEPDVARQQVDIGQGLARIRRAEPAAVARTPHGQAIDAERRTRIEPPVQQVGQGERLAFRRGCATAGGIDQIRRHHQAVELEILRVEPPADQRCDPVVDADRVGGDQQRVAAGQPETGQLEMRDPVASDVGDAHFGSRERRQPAERCVHEPGGDPRILEREHQDHDRDDDREDRHQHPSQPADSPRARRCRGNRRTRDGGLGRGHGGGRTGRFNPPSAGVVPWRARCARRGSGSGSSGRALPALRPSRPPPRSA